MTQARLQSRRYWRDNYATAAVVDYIRGGFDLVKGPPRVLAHNLSSRNLQPARRRLVFQFSQDVSKTLTKGDLVLTNRDTGRVIRLREMRMTYDRVNHVAVWTFPGVARGLLPAGHWTARLKADGIRDGAGSGGRKLDGNYDGIGGDDWSLRFKFKPVV
jgi:hypothetical protein